MTAAVADTVANTCSGPSVRVEREATVVTPAMIDKVWSMEEPRTRAAVTDAVSTTLASAKVLRIAAPSIVAVSVTVALTGIGAWAIVASAVTVPMVATMAAAEDPLTTEVMVVTVIGTVEEFTPEICADADILAALATADAVLVDRDAVEDTVEVVVALSATGRVAFAAVEIVATVGAVTSTLPKCATFAVSVIAAVVATLDAALLASDALGATVAKVDTEELTTVLLTALTETVAVSRTAESPDTFLVAAETMLAFSATAAAAKVELLADGATVAVSGMATLASRLAVAFVATVAVVGTETLAVEEDVTVAAVVIVATV